MLFFPIVLTRYKIEVLRKFYSHNFFFNVPTINSYDEANTGIYSITQVSWSFSTYTLYHLLNVSF